jgi:transcriptional regulator with XRE-family HTH domain
MYYSIQNHNGQTTILPTQKRLFQKQVAEYAGINRKSYSTYEMGEYDSYPIDMLKKIANCLG